MTSDKILSVKQQVEKDGFAILANIFDHSSVKELQTTIETTSPTSDAFRKTNDLFAIRRFLFEIPQIREHIFTIGLKEILSGLFSSPYFSSKSIYFDKPGASNWFVSYHQDLTISVDKKQDVPGFGPWTIKPGQFAVQPPVNILENTFTVRIHLDDTDQNNGALRVIRGSHRSGINRVDEINLKKKEEVICEVPSGGIMIMKPLTLHASSRTINEARRRVIHLEFCNQELPNGLEWAERLPV
ncbi:MAG: phytanoyl-CoA dioxygenase family protein [Chitinophagaceae bacterium]|nr:phytanoyl-CoA dioxygenase family protein [Chitinophagaceae bacterium]